MEKTSLFVSNGDLKDARPQIFGFFAKQTAQLERFHCDLWYDAMNVNNFIDFMLEGNWTGADIYFVCRDAGTQCMFCVNLGGIAPGFGEMTGYDVVRSWDKSFNASQYPLLKVTVRKDASEYWNVEGMQVNWSEVLK